MKLILCAIDVVRDHRLHLRLGNGFNRGIAIEASRKKGIAIEFQVKRLNDLLELLDGILVGE